MQKSITPSARSKRRVTISITQEAHEMGKVLAHDERRDFSAMLEMAIEQKWKARSVDSSAAPEVKP